MRFIWGLVWIAIGIAIIKYSFQITNFFGHIPWAEDKLGGGGTYTAYKLAGIIFILLGFMYMFGMMGVITGTLGPLFGNK